MCPFLKGEHEHLVKIQQNFDSHKIYFHNKLLWKKIASKPTLGGVSDWRKLLQSYHEKQCALILAF